jgi:hypothetical protein
MRFIQQGARNLSVPVRTNQFFGEAHGGVVFHVGAHDDARMQAALGLSERRAC